MNLHKQGLTLFQLSFTQKNTTVVLSILIGLNLVSALLIMLMVACSGIVLVLDEGGQMARGKVKKFIKYPCLAAILRKVTIWLPC